MVTRTTPSRKPLWLVVAVAVLALCQPSGAKAQGALPSALAAAEKASASNEGQAYHSAANMALKDVMITGLRDCFVAHRARARAFKLVFFVGSDGRVRRVVHDQRDPFAACFGKKIVAVQFPRPPRPDWPVMFGIQ